MLYPGTSAVLGRAWAKSPGLGQGLSGLGPSKNPSPAQTLGPGWVWAGPGLKPGPHHKI